jgi:hypothetical protein
VSGYWLQAEVHYGGKYLSTDLITGTHSGLFDTSNPTTRLCEGMLILVYSTNDKSITTNCLLELYHRFIEVAFNETIPVMGQISGSQYQQLKSLYFIYRDDTGMQRKLEIPQNSLIFPEAWQDTMGLPQGINMNVYPVSDKYAHGVLCSIDGITTHSFLINVVQDLILLLEHPFCM